MSYFTRAHRPEWVLTERECVTRILESRARSGRAGAMDEFIKGYHSGDGEPETEGYVMPPRDPYDTWAAVTGAPCPLCAQEIVCYEAGYVPGYRACMARSGDGYDRKTLRHRWLWWDGVLVRDSAAEARGLVFRTLPPEVFLW